MVANLKGLRNKLDLRVKQEFLELNKPRKEITEIPRISYLPSKSIESNMRACLFKMQLPPVSLEVRLQNDMT